MVSSGIGPSIYYPQFEQMQMAFATAGPMMMNQGFAMPGMFNRHCCCERLYNGFSGFVGAVGVFAFAGQNRIDDDPYGIGQSGQGVKSNLANSPEVMLALKDIMSDGQSHSFDDISKTLKEKYGINAEVGDIKTVGKDGKEVTGKGLKFANGDYFVDGNGNGSLDQGDYKFDDAIKNLKEKYGLNDDSVKATTERMKSGAAMGYSNDPRGGMPYYGVAMVGMGQRPMFYNPMMNQNWMSMFAMAFQYAA